MPLTNLTPVQKKELSILKEIIKVIEKNNLHYCAIGGTCLGAVRHKGYIPWDDDIDIVLPRKEYELFRTELWKQLPDPLKKMDGDVSVSYNFLFMRIHDPSTSIIMQEMLGSPDRVNGAFVDIFPVDGRPDNVFIRKIWYIKYVFYMISNGRRRAKKRKITGLGRLVKELYGELLKKLCRYNYFTDAICSYMSKYDVFKCKTAIWNGAQRGAAKKYDYDLSFESDFFTDTVSAPFEDFSIQIPRRYHDYLTTHYGDYMKLPPENERMNWHSVVISDMETPCKYYADLIAEGKMDMIAQSIKERKQI